MSVVLHTSNLCTWEAEVGGFLLVQDQPGLHFEFQDSQGCIDKPCVWGEGDKTKQKHQNNRWRGGLP